MLAGTRDSTCTIETAKEAADTIGDAVELFETFEGKGHLYFWTANDECFVNHIIDLLQTHTEDASESTVNSPMVELTYSNCSSGVASLQESFLKYAVISLATIAALTTM